ncbi:MAG: biotin/lipoyl-containing protein, partial [Bacteroidota bacterium]
AGFSLPDINMNAYMEVRSLTQSFVDDFLGEYINPRNRAMNSLLIGPGLPGGMMGSLMADLENNLKSLNKWLSKRNRAAITQDQLLINLFEEVQYVWPQLGYPPLVTPFSQYVKNVSLMNVIQMIKGKERWSMIDENTWGMILGRSGKLLGPLGEEIQALVIQQNREYYGGKPQDLYPDELEMFAAKMDEKGWDYGEDDEELMEYAMHPTQYEDYRSGKAKEKFEADLAKRRQAKQPVSSTASTPQPLPSTSTPPSLPKTMNIEVNGEQFRVSVSYDSAPQATVQTSSLPPVSSNNQPSVPPPSNGNGHQDSITAPLEGKFYLTKDPSERPVKIGDTIREGDTIAYIEAMKVINAISADKSGTVVEIIARHGEEIEEDDVILTIK